VGSGALGGGSGTGWIVCGGGASRGRAGRGCCLQLLQLSGPRFLILNLSVAAISRCLTASEGHGSGRDCGLLLAPLHGRGARLRPKWLAVDAGCGDAVDSTESVVERSDPVSDSTAFSSTEDHITKGARSEATVSTSGSSRSSPGPCPLRCSSNRKRTPTSAHMGACTDYRWVRQTPACSTFHRPSIAARVGTP